MSFSCTVCYERFESSGDVYAAHCGHMLHLNCWTGWLKRNGDCPDCRKPTLQKQLIKLFFNTGDEDDYPTLKNKYDALRCDLSCKTYDCEAAEKELKLRTEEVASLRRQVQEFTTQIENWKIGMEQCKELLNGFQWESIMDRNIALAEDMKSLKEQKKAVEALEKPTNDVAEVAEFLEDDVLNITPTKMVIRRKTRASKKTKAQPSGPFPKNPNVLTKLQKALKQKGGDEKDAGTDDEEDKCSAPKVRKLRGGKKSEIDIIEVINIDEEQDNNKIDGESAGVGEAKMKSDDEGVIQVNKYIDVDEEGEKEKKNENVFDDGLFDELHKLLQSLKDCKEYMRTSNEQLKAALGKEKAQKN